LGDVEKQLLIFNQPEVYPPMEGGQVLSFELQMIKLHFLGYIAYLYRALSKKH